MSPDEIVHTLEVTQNLQSLLQGRRRKRSMDKETAWSTSHGSLLGGKWMLQNQGLRDSQVEMTTGGGSA